MNMMNIIVAISTMIKIKMIEIGWLAWHCLAIMMVIKIKMIAPGWLAWERFRCNTDCVNDPENCISGHLSF